MYRVSLSCIQQNARQRRLFPGTLLTVMLLTSSVINAEERYPVAQLPAHAGSLPRLDQTSPSPVRPTEIDIQENKGVYQININTILNAPEQSVRHVLTDFIHIYRLNSSIIESDVIKQHEDGSVSVRTKVLGCASSYYCEELERVERVSVLPSGDLLAVIVPGLSQFKSGQTLWQIRPLDEDHCEVIYTAHMEPDIFIPPVIGNFLVKQSIKEQMYDSFSNLERISRVLAEKEWQENYQPELTAFASNQPCDGTTLNASVLAY